MLHLTSKDLTIFDIPKPEQKTKEFEKPKGIVRIILDQYNALGAIKISEIASKTNERATFTVKDSASSELVRYKELSALDLRFEAMYNRTVILDNLPNCDFVKIHFQSTCSSRPCLKVVDKNGEVLHIVPSSVSVYFIRTKNKHEWAIY